MNSFLSFNVVLVLLVFLTTILISRGVEAQTCKPSGKLIGVKPPPGECKTDFDADCCKPREFYTTYKCSPADRRTVLTLNDFQEGGDGGGASVCDEQFYSNDTPVVALSTGWFNNRERLWWLVDECDSAMGCDDEHAYQPPCLLIINIVDASPAVWKALGVPRKNWGELDITWSDAPRENWDELDITWSDAK
ncbi:hypothetical protein MKX01_010678 [Papaver californicum]|nr:hypothetical protein MKX01_010678 [Papaver californicum]